MNKKFIKAFCIGAIIFLLIVEPTSIISQPVVKEEKIEIIFYHTKCQLINKPVTIFFTINNTGFVDVVINFTLKLDNKVILDEENRPISAMGDPNYPSGGEFQFFYELTEIYEAKGTHNLESVVYTDTGNIYSASSSFKITDSEEGEIIFYLANTTIVKAYENLSITYNILNNKSFPLDERFTCFYTENGNLSNWVRRSGKLYANAKDVDTIGGTSRFGYPDGFSYGTNITILSNITYYGETWWWKQIFRVTDDPKDCGFSSPVLIDYQKIIQTTEKNITEESTSLIVPGFETLTVLVLLLVSIQEKRKKVSRS